MKSMGLNLLSVISGLKILSDISIESEWINDRGFFNQNSSSSSKKVEKNIKERKWN